MECTPKYPIEVKLQQPLLGTHKVLSIRTGPQFLGHPVHRRRVFGVALNLARVVWVGPDNPEQEFQDLFYRACSLPGDVLLAGPESQRFAEVQALLARQNNFMSIDEIRAGRMDELLPCCLSRSQVACLEKWTEQRGDMETMGGSLMADLDHNPDA